VTLLSHVRIAGALLFALAAMHIFLPRRLNWNEELSRLSLLNRQIFHVHTFFVVLVVALMGALSLFFGSLLIEPSPLARLVLAGLTCFWTLRLGFQWLVYDASLWRGNRFNTAAHLIFTALWAYLSLVYGTALWAQLNSGAF
jgi:hypothetical protein